MAKLHFDLTLLSKGAGEETPDGIFLPASGEKSEVVAGFERSGLALPGDSARRCSEMPSLNAVPLLAYTPYGMFFKPPKPFGVLVKVGVISILLILFCSFGESQSL